MHAVLLSAVLVFVAELGDKSQLMSMTFATRYRSRTVILGAGLAAAADQPRVRAHRRRHR